MKLSHKSSYDYSISFVRVCAMFFIIICHLGSYFGLLLVGQFFNVGVPIFFMISGYLYGGRRIPDLKIWLMQRMIRLYIPLLLWGIVTSVLTILRGEILPSIKEYLLFLLNLQGLRFVFYNLPELGWGPWFFTVIMFCYFFVALYQLIEQRYRKVELIFYYGGVIPLIAFVFFAYLGVSIPLSFLVGYGLKKREVLKDFKQYNIIVAVVTFTVAIALRLWSNRLLDGTILYDYVIVGISHLMIAVAFFIGVRWLFEVSGDFMLKTASSKILRWLDTISIYVYISHNWFIREFFDLRFPLAIDFLAYFTEVFVVASVLFLIGDRMSKTVERILT